MDWKGLALMDGTSKINLPHFGLGILLLSANATLFLSCGTNTGTATSAQTTYSVEVSTDAGGSLLENDETKDENEEGNAGKDVSKCGESFGTAAKVVSVTGNKATVTIEPAAVMAIKISGNQNEVRVRIRALDAAATPSPSPTPTSETGGNTNAAKPTLDGLCFLVSGNQARARVDVENFRLKRFALHASGNKPRVRLEVAKEGVVDDVTARITGNEGRLEIGGEGTFTCPNASVTGNGTSVQCSK